MTKEKIQNFYSKHTDILNILIILMLLIIGFIFFRECYNGILTDKGREMLFPAAIADGKILYKDILCIYFPLSFQINAVFFKIFGSNLSVLLFLGLICASVTFSLLYAISKQFISKNLSLLFVVTFLTASSFNGTLFNYILPYSTSFTYGITAFLAGLYFVIRYIKTSELKFIHFAYLAGGFAIACKSEFALFFIILVITSFFIQNAGIKRNIVNLCLYGTVPAIAFGSLFLQGLTVEEFLSALDFMHRFFTSEAMIYHITKTGSFPSLSSCVMYVESIFRFVILYGLSFVFFKICEKYRILFPAGVWLSACIVNATNIGSTTVLLPIIISFFLLINIKKIYSENKILFILILSALFLNIRMFWALQLHMYGMLTAHILVLSLIVILFEYYQDLKYFSKEEMKNFIVYMLTVYLLFFIAFDVIKGNQNNTPLITAKGTMRLPKAKEEALEYAIKYIHTYSAPDQKILVLPEGMAINFLAERPLDYKMPMLDRLYYEAFTEDEIIRNLEKADYEMIFIVKGYGLTNFGKPYLYDENNPVMKYIKSKYINDWKTEYQEGKNTNTMYCYVKPY